MTIGQNFINRLVGKRCQMQTHSETKKFVSKWGPTIEKYKFMRPQKQNLIEYL